MLEPHEPAPLAAIPPQRYNPHVPAATHTNTIRINVLFFGRLKDAIGHGQESIEISPDSRIEDLFAQCVARYPELAEHRSAIAVSRNREFAAWSTPLHPGDEIAFLPPVSGG
jgi:molybdopterin converting factor subunit 1